MLTTLSLPALNRLLRANGWALEALAPHGGKTLWLSSPPLDLRVTVSDTGELVPATSATAPDVSIAVTPGVLLRLLAGDERAAREARVEGDLGFAAAVDHVRRNLRPDVEEGFSRVFGDAAAHRMAGALASADRWARSALRNLGENAAEFAVHERPVIAGREALEAFCREVDEVRDDVSRLEKRLERLRARLH